VEYLWKRPFVNIITNTCFSFSLTGLIESYLSISLPIRDFITNAREYSAGSIDFNYLTVYRAHDSCIFMNLSNDKCNDKLDRFSVVFLRLRATGKLT